MTLSILPLNAAFLLRHRLTLFLSVGALAFSALLTNGTAQPEFDAERLAASEVDEGKTLRVDFRLTESATEDETIAMVGETPLPVTYDSFLEAEGNLASYIFMIDISNPRRTRAVAAMRAAVESFISETHDNREFSVHSFSTDRQEVIAFEDDPDTYEEKLGEVRAEGLTTRLFEPANELIELLDEREASRKVLVILSDGEAEDTALTWENVVEKAQAAGVFLHCLSFPENEASSIHDQSLKLMAEEEGLGLFTRLEPNRGWPLSDELRDSYFEHVESGGRFEVAIGDIDAGETIVTTIEFEGGDELVHEHVKDEVEEMTDAEQGASDQQESNAEEGEGDSEEGESEEPSEGEDGEETDSEETEPSTEEGETSTGVGEGTAEEETAAETEASTKWYQNKLILGGIAGFLLLLLIGLILIAVIVSSKKRRMAEEAEEAPLPPWMTDSDDDPFVPQTNDYEEAAMPPTPPAIPGGDEDDDEDETVRATVVSDEADSEESADAEEPVADMSRAYAKLEVLDGDEKGKVFPISQFAVRLGRGSSNEIVLTDTSVSRNHATINRKRDGSFVITDLDSGNKVILNGVEVPQSTLRHQDIFEIGDVKLRFLIV
ncbi:MAG: FHA domain-containing protein [Verrucomicrobiota bacterium]